MQDVVSWYEDGEGGEGSATQEAPNDLKGVGTTVKTSTGHLYSSPPFLHQILISEVIKL